MGVSSISLSIFSALLVLSVLWKPALSDDKCSISCKGSSSSPSFENGQKYNYGVEGIVSIFLTGAEKQETDVKIHGQVSVSALGNCVHVLKVQNLVIAGPDGKKHNKPPGLEKPVQFSLQDGRVGPEICAEEGDTRRSLNIKRAIISLLQTEQKSSTQVDVFGTCPTEVSSSQEGEAILLHRSRDLSRCAHREQSKNDLVTAVYNPTAEIKSTQILQSILNIESKLNNGVPEKISATEEYLYKPFSIGENGARAKVHTKLILSGKSAGADNAACPESRTIIFENPHGGSLESSNQQSALNIVKETTKNLVHEANSKSAGLFAQVIRILRTTNKEDLIKVYQQVKGHSLEKRVFIDALLRAGTGPSVEASIQILKTKELDPVEQKLIYITLSNARHVNNEAVKAAASLLDTPNLPKEVYLSVGALAGAYCREHFCHSGKFDGIKALSQKLAAKLQNCKPKSKIEEDNVVAVLKGIRNIRHLEDNLIDKVVHCAADNSVKARVRAAALEAFHADPCSTKVKKTALDLLKNRNLDSEIRIKAYLAVVECPCGKSANEIKNLLESEPVHQVGRFISSSLRHIRSSANPDKHLARQHYGLIRTPNKFNVDDRKYSFYREASFDLGALGIGGNVEQTVIYSQDSFIPRSASLNLTAEVFGHSVNVFEIGGRQGNLDRVIEHFLGPKGVLRTEDPQTLYDNIVKRYHETKSAIEKGITREKRSIKSEVDNFDKHIKDEAVPYNNELDLDIYVKLFGTDAVFLSFGDDKGFNFNNLVDQFLKVSDDGINKMKHLQHELRAHLLFLDTELTYPTSTGLPLKLNLYGSATGRFEVSTNVDIRQIIRNPENAKLDIKLIPSTDIEIAGLFTVDADSVSTGLKVVTNLHSSTGSHLIAKVLENGHGIDLQLGLPIEKQEIVSASNDLVYVTTEKGQPEKQIPLKLDSDRKEYNGCFDQLSGMLGLTICGEVSVPFSISGPDAQASIAKYLARYPLSGPSKVKVVLEKDDLRGYHVKAVLRTDQPERKSFELLLEAEGSKNRHTHLTGELVNSPQEKTIKLSLDSPIKVLAGQISLYTKPTEYSALIKAKHDTAEYYGRIGFNVQGNEKRSVYKPLAEYELPDERGKQSVKVDGQLVREVNGPITKYTLEGIKINVPNSNELVEVNGYYSQQAKGYEVDIKAKKGNHNLVVEGYLKGHDVKILFQNTLNPYVNFKLIGHFEIGEIIRNEFELFYGTDLEKQKFINFNQLLKYHKKSTEEFNLISKNKIEVHPLALKIVFDVIVDPKKADIEFEGAYGNKKADFKLDARNEIKAPGDYSIKASANIDKDGVEIFAKRDIVNADKSNLENYIVVKNLGKYELSGVVLHKSKPNDIEIGAIGHLKISGSSRKNTDIKFDIGAVENPSLYSSHAKVSGTQGEILDYLMKINRGANTAGQLKFIIKDTIAANGQFKITDNDGTGNGAFIIDFKKIQRKIKSDVKFVVKDPIYNVDVDVLLNFEKDNSDKIHFTTHNKRTEKVLDSKNHLVYAGKKTEVNIHQDGALELTGKIHTNVEVVLPNERCLSLKANRDVTAKDDLYNGHGEVVLSDAVKRGGAASTVSYKFKLVNSNIDKNIVNYEGQIDLKLKEGKKLQTSLFLKNIPQGEASKFDFKADITGDLIPKPASLLASSEYKSDESGYDETYRVKAGYGTDYSVELDGVYKLKPFGGKGVKQYQNDFNVNVHLPFEKAHDIKAVSNVLYLVPENNKEVEYTVVESVQINSDVYKFDASGKAGSKNGLSKLKFLVPHADPVSIDVNYKVSPEGEKKSGSAEIKATYGKGKNAVIVLEGAAAPQDYSLGIKAHAPQAEKIKKLEISIQTKNPTPETYNTVVIVDADGRVYKSESQVVYSKAHPVVDLTYVSPSSDKPRRFYIKGTSISSNHAKVDLKIVNIRDFSLDASSEAVIQRDHILLKFVGDSKELGLKNYQVEISSKDSGSGKRLEFEATNDNKNILSGSTSFISKQEGPKTIIEGSGTVKVKGEQKSANFKYIRTLLTEGNEQGVETFINLAIGERSSVIESRVTNLEYKTSYVYCEEKKQCAHAEIHSKINVQKPGAFQHLLNIGIDLRKLGLAPEFGLQVSNDFSEQKLPQYSLDLHINKEDKKYHLHVYSQPEYGKFPAGITITLPQRVVALESSVSYPTDKGLPFPVKGEIALHLDKNKPQHKSAVRFVVDLNGDDQHRTAVAEVAFSHPRLGKEASIKIHGNLQHPNQNTYKIESTAALSFPSLGERESKLYFEVNPNHVKLLIDTPLVKVVDFEGSTTFKNNLQQGDVKFSVLKGKPVQIRGVVKDFQYYEFTAGYSDETERKLSIIGHLDPENRVDISADIVLPGEKKNIIHGALFLQDNLVKSDYGISKDNFNYFVDALRKDLGNLEERIKKLGDKANHDFKTTIQKVQPTLEQIKKSYSEDLNKFYDEITNDKTLKEISHALDEVFQYLAKLISEVITVTQPVVDNICETINETTKKIGELYEKQLEPQLRQLYGNIAAIVKEYLEGLIDIVAHFAALVTDFFEKHKPEFQELINTLTEIFKDITRLIVAQLKEFRNKVSEIVSGIIQQIKELPIIDFFKEKYEELAVPEQVLALLGDANNALRPLLPTEELKNFVDVLFNYVQKKLRHEKVDDAVELRVVYQKFAAAVTSLVQFSRTQLNQFGVPSTLNINAIPFFTAPGQSVAPSFGDFASFSVVNQILKGDVPDPLALLRTYRPRSINPLDEVPSKLRAVVVNGQHIFTFDGRHLTFPGNCRYVLAHDYVDRNFTLVIQLQNGQPKALVLEDKSGTIVELKESGQVALNGATHGYPVIEKDVYAFKKPNGLIGVGSKYGVLAFCTSKLQVCYFEVSGFYLGKLRGLLGDGNNEPYDDFRLPNGRVSTSESEFGNAYKLASSCAAVTSPAHSAHQHHAALPAPCERVFGGTSPLRPLALLLDVAPFRQACIHAVTGDSADGLHQACDLARGYAALALTGLLPAVLPEVCVKCSDADKPRNVGEEYTLKLPSKQADIVVTVETTKVNEKNYKDLLVPLVSQLVDNLKGKQIDDIKVHLVGVTPKMPYPIVYDTDLKLKTPKVRFTDESRYQTTPTIKTGCSQVDKVQHIVADLVDTVKVKLGLTNIVAGYTSVLELPLRAGAVKHIIHVIGEHCQSQLFLVEILRSVTYSVLFEENAMTHTLITVTPDLKIGGGKNVNQVVGFTEDSVLLLGDKKHSKESEALRPSLEIYDDACIDFVESTEGLILSATNYHGLNAGQQKQFLQTAANSITHQLLHQNLVQKCYCGYVDPFRVASYCFNEDRKEVARRRK